MAPDPEWWKWALALGAVGAVGYVVWKYVVPAVAAAPPPGAAIGVRSVEVSPGSVALGSPVTVTVTSENTGTASGGADVSVTADGVEIKRFSTGAIEPGKTATNMFTWTPPGAKTYTVCGEIV